MQCVHIYCQIQPLMSSPTFPSIWIHLNNLTENYTLHSLQFCLLPVPIWFNILSVHASCWVNKLNWMVYCVVLSHIRQGTHSILCSPLIWPHYSAWCRILLYYWQQCCSRTVWYCTNNAQHWCGWCVNHSEYPVWICWALITMVLWRRSSYACTTGKMKLHTYYYST